MLPLCRARGREACAILILQTCSHHNFYTCSMQVLLLLLSNSEKADKDTATRTWRPCIFQNFFRLTSASSSRCEVYWVHSFSGSDDIALLNAVEAYTLLNWRTVPSHELSMQYDVHGLKPCYTMCSDAATAELIVIPRWPHFSK